jgi:preprotein translocase subunit SecE
VSQTRSDAEGLGGSSAQIDPQDADERAAAEEDEFDSDLTDSAQFEDYGDADEDDDAGDSDDGSDDSAKGAKAKTKTAKRGERDRDRRRKAPAGKRGAAKSGTKTAPKKQPPAPRRKRTSPGLYYRQIVAEMRKVVWPTRSELMTYTSVVIVFVLCIIGFVALVDFGVERAVQAVFG